jgi:hypothetical protein
VIQKLDIDKSIARIEPAEGKLILPKTKNPAGYVCILWIWLISIRPGSQWDKISPAETTEPVLFHLQQCIRYFFNFSF